MLQGDTRSAEGRRAAFSGVVWGGEIAGRQHTDVMGSRGWGVCRCRGGACRAQMLRGEEAAEALAGWLLRWEDEGHTSGGLGHRLRGTAGVASARVAPGSGWREGTRMLERSSCLSRPPTVNPHT